MNKKIISLSVVAIFVVGFLFLLNNTTSDIDTEVIEDEILTESETSTEVGELTQSSNSSIVYSSHPTIGKEVYMEGPVSVVAGEENQWTVSIPKRLVELSSKAPSVEWGDGIRDGYGLGATNRWMFDSEGNAYSKHTYVSPGSYSIQVLINGSGEEYNKGGTVVINSEVTVMGQ